MRPILAAAALAVSLLGAPAAQASIVHYSTVLSGATEVPGNGSPASGLATVDYDDVLQSLLVHVEFTGLIGGPAAAAHIHCCTLPGTNVGVAVGFPGFPVATSGVYDHLFDLTDAAIYTASFLNNFGGGTAAGAQAALLAGLAAPQHMAYVNIHNAVFPGGEIRGLLAVPEPSGMALTALALAGLAVASRRRRV